MTRRLSAIAGLTLLLTSPVLAQRDAGVYTQPVLPSQKDLDRLNMTMAWKTFLPLNGRGDGIASIQFIENRVYVQTHSNVLIVLRASTGEEEWRVTMPNRYIPSVPLAVNHDLVCVINGPRLYLLDKANGKQKFNVELPSTVAAGVAADIQQCFIALSNNRVISVGLQAEDVRLGLRVRPKPEALEMPTGIKVEPQSLGVLSTTRNNAPSLTMLHSLRPPFVYSSKENVPSLALIPSLRKPYQGNTGNSAPSLQMLSNLTKLSDLAEINAEDKPRVLWELQANRRIEDAPLMYGEFLILVGARRSVLVCNKFAQKVNRIRHEYAPDATVAAPLGQYGSDLYVTLMDGNSFWVNVESFRNAEVPVLHLKRFLTPYPIDRKPLTTDDSVYLAGSQAGLTRLTRRDFESVWSNAEVDRILAVNPNFVYASDRRGNLLVLDRARGLKMATLDTRSFTIPLVNEQNDRLYLAAPNGLLVCLHDRTFPRPVPLKKDEIKPEVVLGKDLPKNEPEAKKESEPKKAPEPKKPPEPGKQ